MKHLPPMLAWPASANERSRKDDPIEVVMLRRQPQRTFDREWS
jgi:hypothetical protein